MMQSSVAKVAERVQIAYREALDSILVPQLHRRVSCGNRPSLLIGMICAW